MTLPQFGTGDASLFATHRAGRTPTVIDPKVLAQVTALLSKDGLVQGQEFYSATKNETDVYNGQRETAAKSASKEVPAAITIGAMAQRNARTAANAILPYVTAAIEKTFVNKSYSLRFVDQGTEDNPRVLWAFVLVNPRQRASK